MTGHLICIGGLPGVGKTTVARKLNEILKGAIVLDPDKIHLNILGKNPEIDRLCDENITDKTTQQTIKSMKNQALLALTQGKTVIIGSAFLLVAMRKGYERMAEFQGALFTPIWLEADVTERVARAEKRLSEQNNPSGVSLNWVKTVSIEGELCWPIIDASRSVDEVCKEVMAVLKV